MDRFTPIDRENWDREEMYRLYTEQWGNTWFSCTVRLDVTQTVRYQKEKGQKFIPASLDRIKSLKSEIDRRGLKVEIEVDGGVGAENASALKAAGAGILVAGSSVFKAPSPQDAIDSMR